MQVAARDDMRKTLVGMQVFFLWLLNSLLGFWLFYVARNALLTGLALYYVKDQTSRAWRAAFWDRAYFAIGGLAYLIFLFAIHGYLKEGAARGAGLQRFARVAAIELSIVAVFDLTLSWMEHVILTPAALALHLAEVFGAVGLFCVERRSR